ncbi:MAG: spore cortex-lytic protein, partial [Clostridia bacterium]|nr:spore cortex-lytic protein [Clostridia bacterium]
MPEVRYPIIPEFITVHLGPPGSQAENVTVSFIDYVKNVASSEIYPTWPESALRANIYAIISYALNRVYTEYYPSRGYNFDITNSTQFDQAFVRDREIYENISYIVDDIFNDYIVRQGTIQPLFAAFCNGTTSVCDGLSQWG